MWEKGGTSTEWKTQNESPEKVLEEFNNAASAERNAAFLTKLMDMRLAIINKAKENIAAAQEKQRKHNCKHANPAVYHIGSEVLVKEFLQRKKKEGKIDYCWLGPYVILNNLGKGIQLYYAVMDHHTMGAYCMLYRYYLWGI